MSVSLGTPERLALELAIGLLAVGRMATGGLGVAAAARVWPLRA